MRIRDYLYLANKNLKIKKRGKSLTIVLGIAILLVSMFLFIFLNFNFSIDNNLNENAGVRGANVSMSNSLNSDILETNVNYQYFDDLISIKGVEDYISYYQYSLNNFENDAKITLDGNEYMMDKPSYYAYEDGGILQSIGNHVVFDVFDIKNSSKLFIESDYQVVRSPILCGSEFSGQKGEIMVNSFFFESYGLNPLNYIGKTISLEALFAYDRFSSNANLASGDYKGDYYHTYGYLFKDFKIVGVFDGNIYRNILRCYEGKYQGSIEIPLFWFNSISLFNDQIINYPSFDAGDNKYYYQASLNDMMASCVANDMIFLPLGIFVENNTSTRADATNGFTLMQFDSIKNLYHATGIIDNIVNISSTDGSWQRGGWFYTYLFLDYYEFYPLYQYISAILIFIAVVVITLNLLNIINMVYHNIQIKERYFGLLRAIGLDNRSITALYFCESAVMFFKSIIIAFIPGIIISFLFKYMVEKIIFHLELYTDLPFTINVSIFNFFISIAIVSIILFIIYSTISILFSIKLYKRKIIDVINDN